MLGEEDYRGEIGDGGTKHQQYVGERVQVQRFWRLKRVALVERIARSAEVDS